MSGGPQPAGYRAEVRVAGPAFGAAGTVQYVLGAVRTTSAEPALGWLCGEALRIADRLDPDPERSAWVRPAMRTAPVSAPAHASVPAPGPVPAPEPVSVPASEPAPEPESLPPPEPVPAPGPAPDCPAELRVWATDPDEQRAAREQLRAGGPLVVRVPDAGGTFILSVRPADSPWPPGGRRMGRPTSAEKAAARQAARADRQTIIERYGAREPLARIADAYGVTPGWLALRLDEWGVPRRQRYGAHLHRRPARRLFRGRMPRRTRTEVRAAQAEFTDRRTEVVTRYRDGESIASLARSFHVGHAWVAERLNEWGVPRR
ncbi:hypothetical protein [Streptomyces sp. NPDC006012]|uniref:hypothetical protein n=1 Tax=Streptomyces sp. NPDC006012 TaxID=3364739 RepID=UPI0036B3764A